jgi:hypothetical protein
MIGYAGKASIEVRGQADEERFRQGRLGLKTGT